MHNKVVINPYESGELFAVVRSPAPEIAVAIVGPLDPWKEDKKFQCLVVGRDGVSITSLRGCSAEAPWPELFRTLAKDDDNGESASLRTISDTNYWASGGDPCPASFRRYAREQGGTDDDNGAINLAQVQLHQAVGAALEFVDAGFREVLLARQELPLRTASALMQFTQLLGGASRKFMLQALRTESCGILRAAAEELSAGKPQLADVIASGSSLPMALLRQYSIPCWLHRTTLQPGPLRSTDIGGAAFLAVLQATARIRSSVTDEERIMLIPVTKDFVQKIFPCEMPDAETWDQILKTLFNCAPLIEDALTKYLRIFKEIQTCVEALDAARAIKSTTILRWVLTTLPAKRMGDHEERLAMVADAVIALSSSLQEQIASAAKRHPRLPSNFLPYGASHCVPLDSLEKILQTGATIGNCLAQRQQAVDYIARGAALYLLEVEGAQAVCALGLSRGGVEVSVLETEAAKNAPLLAPFPRAAWDLACACSQHQETLDAFTAYEASASILREHLATAGITTESRDFLY